MLLIIESGHATLVSGKIVDSKPTVTGEVGGSIKGGESTAVAEWDVLLISANVPHQVLVAGGNRVTYVLIKQQRQESRSENAAPPGRGSLRKKPAQGVNLAPDFERLSLVTTRPTAQS